jgi:hypothetical protein
MRHVVLAAALLAASPAAAADLRAGIMRAAEHAEYASEATTIDDVHFHLHHSLNCLVGPGGSGFDKTQLNPCRGAGDGILADVPDAVLAKTFEGAAAKARAGLATNDLAVAKSDATDVARIVMATLKSVK